MRKEFWKKVYVFALVLAVGAIMSSCGGGGGGGSTTPTTTTPTTTTGGDTAGKTITISGTFSDGDTVGRVAGRSAGAPVASTPIIAYVLGDSNRTAINDASDTTSDTGTFTITVDIGSADSANIIIEALPSGSSIGATTNIRVALEDLENDVSVTATPKTAAEGLLWLYTPGESLASVIKPIVKFFDDESMDIRATMSTAAKGETFVNAMKAVNNACKDETDTDTKKKCIINSINGQTISDEAVNTLVERLQTKYKIDTDTATLFETLKFYAPDQTDADINSAIYIANIGGASLTNIDSESEAAELFNKLATAIDNVQNPSDEGSFKVEVKNGFLPPMFGQSFTNSDIENIFIYLKAGYESVIGQEAADLSALVSQNDMISTLSGYDAVLGMLIEILVKDANISDSQAWTSVDGLIYCLEKLGETSEDNTSMQAVLDDWVPAYADSTFRDKFHAFMDPLGMDSRTKTEQLMQMSHDLGDTDGSRAQVENTLSQYLTAPTVAEAMVLYDNYYGSMNCTFDVASRTIGGSNCITQEEIVSLLETHFEKDLPILDDFLTDVQTYIQDNSTKFAGLASLTDMINDMKASAANKAEIGDVMEAAGIPEELFWLYLNLEPYM